MFWEQCLRRPGRFGRGRGGGREGVGELEKLRVFSPLFYIFRALSTPPSSTFALILPPRCARASFAYRGRFERRNCIRFG